MWRKQLRSSTDKPVRFALVETTTKPNGAGQQPARQVAAPTIELILSTGERMQIPADAGTLRVVLEALQQRA